MTGREAAQPPENRPPSGRLWLGGSVFLIGQVIPLLLVPLVAGSALSTEWKAALSGILLLGVPELFILIAVVILGKPGFDFLKKRVLGWLGQHFAPAETVGPTRYRIGLVLFLIPLAFGWVTPYAGHLMPGYEDYRALYGIAGDILVIASLFVLGGEFWDKLRALFVREARVTC